MSEPRIQARIETSVLEMRRMIAQERFRRANQPAFLEWLDRLDVVLGRIF